MDDSTKSSTNLHDHTESSHRTIAEAVGDIYQGSVVQVYWSESSGSTYYSDYTVDKHMYLEGTVLWGRGDVLALECLHKAGGTLYKKQILVNSYNVTMIALKDPNNLDLVQYFQGRIHERTQH